MNGLIMRNYNSVTIYQRRGDRYLDATAMCRANNKLWGHYWENQSTHEFVNELSSVIGIPVDGLVQTRQGGVPAEQGTWVHPRIAIHLGQWCSAKFAVAVSGWVEELLATGSVAIKPLGPLEILKQQVALMEAQEQRVAQAEQVALEAQQVALAVKTQVAEIVDRRDEAENSLWEAERSETPAATKSSRAKLNELVRHYVISTGAEYWSVWQKLYRELRYRNHFDAAARSRKGKKQIDVVEEAGMMEALYSIASEILIVEA